MIKIPLPLLERVTTDTCKENELVVLPIDGDIGFEEYFFYKANEVRKAKHLFAPKERTEIILTYPSPPNERTSPQYTDTLFERFFETPSVVAHNQLFEGCFGIDISAYINHWDTKEFLDLMSFVKKNPQITFVLFVYSNNSNEDAAMLSFINQFIEISLVQFDTPSCDRLAAYTCDQLRNVSLIIDASFEGFIRDCYDDLSVGYDFADAVVNSLRSRMNEATLEDVRSIVDRLIKQYGTSSRNDGFGY